MYELPIGTSYHEGYFWPPNFSLFSAHFQIFTECNKTHLTAAMLQSGRKKWPPPPDQFTPFRLFSCQFLKFLALTPNSLLSICFVS